MNPDQWSLAAENRTMAGRAQGAGGTDSGGTGAVPGAATGASGGPSGTGTGAAGGGAGAAAMAGIGFALQKAHQTGTALAGRMEQTAAHGGMQGAYPYSTVSGGQRTAPPGAGSHPASSGSPEVPGTPPAWGSEDAAADDERLANGGPEMPPPDWSGYNGEGE